MDILQQLGGNVMGNLGNMGQGLGQGLSNLGGSMGMGDINTIIAQGGTTPGGYNAGAQMRQRGQTPPADVNKLKMAMLLGGLGGGMGGAGGGQNNMQQMLPLLMLLSKLQGGMP